VTLIFDLNEFKEMRKCIVLGTGPKKVFKINHARNFEFIELNKRNCWLLNHKNIMLITFNFQTVFQKNLDKIFEKFNLLDYHENLMKNFFLKKNRNSDRNMNIEFYE